MKRIRFVLLGGFLGAGKTTAIARLARHFIDRGRKVGLVTNDQASGLVDTRSLQAQGFRVGEVAGACFCCDFDGLVSTIAQLDREETPDWIIAEPVGSCTDLAATVLEPLRRLHGDRYELGPLAVLLKPEHGLKILGNRAKAGFSQKAAYIFLKQLEEADLIAVNKIDKLTGAQLRELEELTAERFPETPLLPISARDGTGFDRFIDALGSPARASGPAIEMDYDTYAEEEAEFAWFNGTIEIRSNSGDRFSLDELVLDLVVKIRAALLGRSVEPAHLKVLGRHEGSTSVANLVDSEEKPELSIVSRVQVATAELLVNARVAGSPESLRQDVGDAVAALAGRWRLEANVIDQACFRPARPVPTHRVVEADPNGS